MNENQKYKAIQKILKKVSLTRRDSDWEKMNGLLNTHMPVKPPSVSPFHSVKLLAYGGSVVLTATITVMIHQGFQRSNKQKQETIVRQGIQMPDSGRTIRLPAAETTSLSKPSFDSVYYAQSKMNISFDSNTINVNEQPSTVNRSRNDAGSTINRSRNDAGSTVNRSRNDAGSTVNRSRNDAGSTTNRQTSKVYKTPHNLTIFITEQETARLESEQKKYTSWISKIQSNKKDMSGGMKLSDVKSVADKKLDGGSYFRFGFGLPLVQYYTSNPDQTFQLNYIPGLTGQYVINRHWGLGLNIFPYQNIPFNDSDSIYTSFGRDSSISPNNIFTKKYYLNTLSAWASEINLEYQINNHIGIEAGLGIQGIWNAKGHVTTLSTDTLYNQPNQPFPGNHTSTQDMHYSRSDQRISNLEKFNFCYSLRLVYQSEKWSASLGYNQNGKVWLPTSPGNSPGWIRLQFNYYFLTGKKESPTGSKDR